MKSDVDNRQQEQKPQIPRLEILLRAIAWIITISILLKGIIDVDGTFDTWGYHLPFAARIWHIVPGSQFINMEERFAGFPLLGEFFQGFLWLITQRVQSANLVGFFSLVLYCYFLKRYFQIAYYTSAIALLAVPLIQAHAVNSYVDLMANIFLAMMIMMAYVIWQQKTLPSKRDLWVIFLAAGSASNTKPQIEPLVFLVLIFIFIRIIWLWRHNNDNQQQSLTLSFKAITLTSVALILIFATPIKNIVIHGNPFYPVRIEIAGKVLNHALPLYDDAPGYLVNAPKAQRWLYSVSEIKRAYWNHDQYSANPDRNRMGGFFNVYVLFQVLLLLYLVTAYRNQATRTATIVMAVISLIAANFPQSHELRYFMYWMIVLISLNLYLITKYGDRIFNPRSYTLVALIALMIVGIKTEFVYLKPSFNTLSKFKEKKTSSEILAQIKPGDRICLPRNYPFSFMYAPWFHPELDFNYRIRSGFLDSCDPAENVL